MFIVRPLKQVRLCDSCLASKGKHCPPHLNYKNLGPDACWPDTSINHQTYLSMSNFGGELSPWCCVEGFQIETVCFDWLHNMYLGVGRDVVASGIWLFIRQGVYDHFNLDDMDELLGNIHMEIKTTCKQYKCFGYNWWFVTCFVPLEFWNFVFKTALFVQLFILVPGHCQSRLSLPTKPVLSVANLGGLHDYPELGSKYKGCHVKVLLWWMSFKSQEVANGNPGETWFWMRLFFFNHQTLPKKTMCFISCDFRLERLGASQPPPKWCDQLSHKS